MQSPLRLRGTLSVLMLGFGATISCSDRPAQPPPSGAGPGDAAFTELARQILDDHHKRHPSAATDLGLHQYDAELEDASEAAIHAERSEEHTSELQSRFDLVCRLLLEKKKKT